MNTRIQKILFACFLIYLSIPYSANGQNKSIHLFRGEGTLTASLKPFVKGGTVFTLNDPAVDSLLRERPRVFIMAFRFENKDWRITLEENDIYSAGFFVKDAGGKPVSYDRTAALHYKGKMEGSFRSFAAVTIMKGEIMAVLADEQGNINIGALKNASARAIGQHIIFRESNLAARNPFQCETADLPETGSPVTSFTANTAAVLNPEPVDVYFEADYQCYLNNDNSITNTVNWAAGLFNMITAFYDNDSIAVRMSGIKVWDSPDPYISAANMQSALPLFGQAVNAGFPGDVAHLLSQRGLGGGIAGVNILCNPLTSSRTSLTGNLNNDITPLPAYSWNVMAVSHELGHNIGSHHTQWCRWPGGAIDNCYSVEGTCAPGPAPINGGTVMSYCHLAPYGINLANGFGPLPGAAVRNAVRTTTCINPRVSFNTSFQTITEEDADIISGCERYKLITLKLALNYTPTQPAIITLLPGSATTPPIEIGPGKDVDISPLSFTLTDTVPKNIYIKVYDDAIIENPERLVLDFAIANNGTNAIKNGTYQLLITSLDHRPDSLPQQILYYEPFDRVHIGDSAWTQTIVYGNASPNRWVIGNPGDPLFPSAAFVSANGSTAGYAGTGVNDSSVIRFESPVIDARLFSGMTLNYFYRCLGEGSSGQGNGGGVAKDFGRVYYSINGGADWLLLRDNIYNFDYRYRTESLLPANANGAGQLRLAFEWRNNSSVVNNPGLIVDSVVISGSGFTPVQSAPHPADIAQEYLGPWQTVHFYNAVTKNIMATIVNKSAHDFGCTTLELLRTGIGAAQAWGSADVEKIADKVYRVTPTYDNPDSPYELSLYYTTDEINGWATATGNAVSNLGIIKTTAGITQSPPVGSPLYSNYNSIDNYGKVDKKITGAFTGFSVFGIGKAGITVGCAESTMPLSANETAVSYQWQVNSGNVFTNIENSAIYSGVNTVQLIINNAPTSFYGYSYRCILTNAQGTHNSIEYTLKFEADWLGTVSNEWENPLNWRCNVLPDENTDVFINEGSAAYPVVNSNTTVRSIMLRPSSAILIQSGVNFSIRK